MHDASARHLAGASALVFEDMGCQQDTKQEFRREASLDVQHDEKRENRELPHYRIEIQDSVAVFIISRPHKANALSRQILLALGGFAREASAREDIRALVISADGDRHFCAGADLEERLGFDDDTVREQIRLYRSELGALQTNRKLVVAAVNGLALGGGLEIALACDLRVASASAVFGMPECSIGIIPGAGGTQRLPRLIGLARAKQVVLLGRRLTSQEALEWGLVDRIATHGSVLDDAIQWIRPVCNGAAIAQSAALEAIRAASETTLEQGLEAEAAAYERTLESEDRLEGIRAFREKRLPHFKGR